MSPVSHITVTESEAGQKLLNFLMRRLADDVPRSALMRWIRTGQIRVDKGRAKPFDRVNKGAVIRVPPQAVLREVADAPGVDVDKPVDKRRGGKGAAGGGPGKSGQAMRSDSSSPSLPPVVFEDDGILVLSKPCGLAVHGGSKVEDSLAARLEAAYRGAAFTPTLAHRLDRETSGLIVAAKTYETLRVLHALMQGREVVKVYLAWVAGTWKAKGVAELRDTLGKARGREFEKVETGSGKEGVSLALPLVRGEERSLLALRLVTGRTHQLRVQLASRGHAVLGDRKYQGPPSRKLRLHAWRLVLPAGESGPERSFSADPDWSGHLALPSPMPETWQALLSGADV